MIKDWVELVSIFLGYLSVTLLVLSLGLSKANITVLRVRSKKSRDVNNHHSKS